MPEEYVVDTSVTTKIFINEEHTDIAKRLYKKAHEGNNSTFITADKVHYNKTKDLIGSVMLLKNFK